MITKEEHDLDNDLARDIGFALSRSPLRVKGKQSQRIETCVMVAKEVVIHLKRCLWKFEKLPPAEPHGLM